VIEDGPKAVRDGEALDVAKLAEFLGGPVTIEQFPGGHSNLTYLVHQGDRELVLRRPPFGSKVKSAHDMGREVAVLSKLAPVYDRAPRVIAYEPTGDVLGAPFYLMERRRGVILRKDVPDDPALIARVCDLLVDALVDLHAVDYATAGLGDFGKPAGYVGRQVSGWIERYAGSQTDEIAAMASAGAWLAAHQPADGPPALIHNDFKFDNVIFDTKLERITGVLDWEMATIGDPLMDLGTALAYWMQANDGPVFQNVLFGVTTKPHMPARVQIAQRYFERSGRTASHLVFYYVFGLYKTAVILQ
jgi:aminoglycoside phosphotransferase (APT) family kinase protein